MNFGNRRGTASDSKGLGIVDHDDDAGDERLHLHDRWRG